MNYYKQEGNRKNEHKKLILRVPLKPERFPPNLDAKDIFFYASKENLSKTGATSQRSSSIFG